jgi:hypothetical protein
MRRRTIGIIGLGAVVALVATPLPGVQAKSPGRTAWVLTKDGRSVEGALALDSLVFTVNGSPQKIALRDVRSFHSADPATASEAARIGRGLAAVQGKDAKAVDPAAEDLTDLGLPVLSPLLATYKDTDAHEPDPLYRLFGRLVPGFADAADRKLDLIRLANGTALRGKLSPVELRLAGVDGKTTVLAAHEIRRLAVKQASVERTFDLQALRHCTYVSWLDTGLAVTPTSQLKADSAGYVRLSFDEDGWACDPDGIADPLPGKRRMQEGFRWGAVLGRVGPSGARWLAGKHIEKTALGTGRLYFVVNDNEHWQNNIGSYRVHVRVTDTYDLSEPQ